MKQTDIDGGGHGAAAGANGPQPAPSLAFRVTPLFLLIAGLGAAYGLGLHTYVSLDWLVDQRQILHDFVSAYPLRAAALFFLVYVAVVALSIPAASVLTIFSGFLFGWLGGGLLVVAAATVGSCLLFAAAHTAFGDILRQRAGPFLGRFAAGFSKNAFGYLLVLRLAPIFPFFVVNIAPAFFSVSLRTFAAATIVGIIPGTFVYAWLGRGCERIIEDAAMKEKPLMLSDFLVPEMTFALMALAVIAALPLIVQVVREKRRSAAHGEKH